MAITIDWGNTYVINVPKSDLSLIQASPTEIREMDLDWFRLQLKALEESEAGMAFPDTHSHNTEASLGGLTFARVVEVLDPYTVTFEDGQYAVNLTGANSNVGDKVNVNQVSVRTQNSAGLISTPLIEVASFENGVSWDPQNDTGKAVATTTGLAGSRNQPLLNLSDVEIVAAHRKFNTIYVLSNANNLTGGAFDRFLFYGQSHVQNAITVAEAADVLGCTFSELHITGTLDGMNQLDSCVIEDLTYVNGHIHNCGIKGFVRLDGGINAVMSRCQTIDPYDPPVLDMGGSGQNCAMPAYDGLLTVTNLTGAGNFLGIGLRAGEVVLDSATVTAGVVHVSGIGTLKDEVGNEISSGTWNGGVTVINSVVSGEHIGEQLDDIEGHLSVLAVCEASGALRQITLHVEDGLGAGVPDVQMSIFADDNVTFLTNGRTDPQGDFVTALQLGSYNVRLAKARHAFTVPEPLVVTADQITTFTTAVISPAPPSAPSLCVVYGTIRDAEGEPQAGLCVTARSIVPQDVDSVQYSEEEVTTKTDVNGYFEIELVRGTTVRFIVETTDFDFDRFVPDAASQDLTVWDA